MPFKGEQAVEFPTGSSNVLVFFAENMHGKTSFLNSVRWCFFGEVLNRLGQQIRENELINFEAQRENQTTMYVSINFEADGNEYDLKRTLDISSGTPNSRVFLNINGKEKPGDTVEREIEKVLPKQLANFFLFDGELLSQFENLVADQSSAQAKQIKNNIERTLGLPLIKRGRDEIAKVARKYSSEIKKDSKKRDQDKVRMDSLIELERQLDDKRKELSELQENIQDNDENLEKLKQDIDNARGISEKAVEKETKEKELQNREQNKAASEASRRKALAKAWELPLQFKFIPILQKLDEKRGNLSKIQEQHIKLAQRIKELTSSLQEEICASCNQPIPQSNRDDILRNVDKLNTELDTLRLDDLESESLNEKYVSLKPLTETSITVNEINTHNEAVAQQELAIIRLQNEISEIEGDLRQLDADRAKKLTQDHDRRLSERGKLNKEEDELSRQINDLEINIRNLRSQISTDTDGEDNAASRLYQIATECEDAFSKAMDKYVSIMREKVEARANYSFSKMTTEQEFEKLEINESYGLHLISSGDTMIRSAGAEQIVAISLIEALNHLGRRKGPMLMDTPFGRLDLSHRKNIMEYLPSEVTQLAIFAHSGEIDEKQIYFSESKIGARYRIVRKSSQNSSIERL